MQIHEHIALGDLTTFGIGGPARFFVSVQTVDDIREALAFANEKKLGVFILGGGSNTLVSDKGFDGLVIKIELQGIEQNEQTLTAAAGESWDGFVAFAVKNNLWGIENLSGIPGTVGGAVVQNIGAYGAALSQTLQSTHVFDSVEQKIKTLLAGDCQFGYRSSIFKKEEGRYVVLSATFKLSQSPTPNISYKDLAARFNDSSIDVRAVRDAVLEIRKGKFPDLSVEGTAGSFFKNPFLSSKEADALRALYPEIPLYTSPDEVGTKVPLGWVFDHVLHAKGTSVRGVRLFEKQALVIAAHKGASAADVKELATEIQKKVFDALKIKIEPEVKIL